MNKPDWIVEGATVAYCKGGWFYASHKTTIVRVYENYFMIMAPQGVMFDFGGRECRQQQHHDAPPLGQVQPWTEAHEVELEANEARNEIHDFITALRNSVTPEKLSSVEVSHLRDLLRAFCRSNNEVEKLLGGKIDWTYE